MQLMEIIIFQKKADFTREAATPNYSGRCLGIRVALHFKNFMFLKALHVFMSLNITATIQLSHSTTQQVLILLVSQASPSNAKSVRGGWLARL